MGCGSSKQQTQQNQVVAPQNPGADGGDPPDDGVTPADLLEEGSYTWKRFTNVNVSRQIGIGSYGRVCVAKIDGMEVVFKKFHVQDYKRDVVLKFFKELNQTCSLDHPNVLKVLGACIDPPDVGIITEFIPNGNLADALREKSKKKAMLWPAKMKVAADICDALAYLHGLTPQVLHGNLKSSNVLLGADDVAKVSDFGFQDMKILSQTMTTTHDPAWLSPEILKGEDISPMLDVYSLGVIMWELATGQHPFEGNKSMKTVMMIVSGDRPKVPVDLNEDYKALMEECWQDNPADRPSLEEYKQRIGNINM